MSIVVEGLTKTYGPQKAISNLSFTVNKGEILGFLGPNGAGKSTTMKIIACYLAPTEGDVTLEEMSIHTNAGDIKKKIGYLPENNPLYMEMDVMDYLAFCGEIQGIGRAEVKRAMHHMVEVCGLTKEKHKRIHQLSKGYRQRVGLAQALIHDPEVLILDEPTSGLDPNQIVEIRNLIREIGKEKTVILSSHILSEVEATCDRILIINRGRIVADGSAESLRASSEGKEALSVQIAAKESPEEVQGILHDIDSVEKVELLADKGDGCYLLQSKPKESSRKDIFRTCVDKDWTLLEMTGKGVSLEDVFRELTN